MSFYFFDDAVSSGSVNSYQAHDNGKQHLPQPHLSRKGNLYENKQVINPFFECLHFALIRSRGPLFMCVRDIVTPVLSLCVLFLTPLSLFFSLLLSALFYVMKNSVGPNTWLSYCCIFVKIDPASVRVYE